MEVQIPVHDYLTGFYLTQRIEYNHHRCASASLCKNPGKTCNSHKTLKSCVHYEEAQRDHSSLYHLSPFIYVKLMEKQRSQKEFLIQRKLQILTISLVFNVQVTFLSRRKNSEAFKPMPI